MIYIVGFDRNGVKLAFKELDEFFDDVRKNSAVFKCNPSQASLIFDRRTSNAEYPITITMKKDENGVEISGPSNHVQLGKLFLAENFCTNLF